MFRLYPAGTRRFSAAEEQHIGWSPLRVADPLLKITAAKAVDYFLPKCDRGLVARELFDLPLAREAVE